MRVFETGASRDTDEGKLKYHRFLSPAVLRRYCEYLEKHRVCADGSLRDPDNWKKGIGQDVYVESLLRHAFEAWQQWEQDGVMSQDTLCAILFNTMGYLFEDIKKGR